MFRARTTCSESLKPQLPLPPPSIALAFASPVLDAPDLLAVG